jgi:predicted dinucleotide-binding enzyme
MHDNRCIGIVGCGNMGLAVAHRLSLYGFSVVMGSRCPDRQNSTQLEIVFIVECIRRSPIIFVAIHPEHYIDSLVSYFEQEPSLFNKKILIDLSNEPCEKSHQNDSSNAERLQTAIPNAFVVKHSILFHRFSCKVRQQVNHVMSLLLVIIQ